MTKYVIKSQLYWIRLWCRYISYEFSLKHRVNDSVHLKPSHLHLKPVSHIYLKCLCMCFLCMLSFLCHTWNFARRISKHHSWQHGTTVHHATVFTLARFLLWPWFWQRFCGTVRKKTPQYFRLYFIMNKYIIFYTSLFIQYSNTAHCSGHFAVLTTHLYNIHALWNDHEDELITNGKKYWNLNSLRERYENKQKKKDFRSQIYREHTPEW